jgi:hypothetical protein
MYVNGKMRTIETTPGLVEKGDKGEWWRVLIQIRYILYIVRNFVNATMFPIQHNNKKKSLLQTLFFF